MEAVEFLQKELEKAHSIELGSQESESYLERVISNETRRTVSGRNTTQAGNTEIATHIQTVR